MSISGVLTQAQASESNLAASIKQWLYQNCVGPYNTAASSAGLNNGLQLQGDGSWKSDNLGLTIMYAGPTDDALYEHVPAVGYLIDDKAAGKDPEPTGCGDMANWEYRSVGFCFLPTLKVTTDVKGIQSDRHSQFLLRSSAVNALLRTKILPIVDSTAAPTNPLPQIGYAEIVRANIFVTPHDVISLLNTHKLRFDANIELRWAVQGTN